MSNITDGIASIFTIGDALNKLEFSLKFISLLPEPKGCLAIKVSELLSLEEVEKIIEGFDILIDQPMPIDFDGEGEMQDRCILILANLWCDCDHGSILERAGWLVDFFSRTRGSMDGLRLAILGKS